MSSTVPDFASLNPGYELRFAINVQHTKGGSMQSRLCRAIVAAGLSVPPPPAQPATNRTGAFRARAKAAAQFDFLGTLARLCVLPQTAPGQDVAPPPPPARATWYTDPGKVFDNLYFVGTKIHSAWALTSSEGIILIDTVYDYNSEEAIVEGMKKLGLDPASVKY